MLLLSCTHPPISFINLTRSLKYTRVDGFKHLMNTYEMIWVRILFISRYFSILFNSFPLVRFPDNPVYISIHCCLPEPFSDVIMSAMASQIATVSIVCSTVCSGADQRKHKISVPLAFVKGIHRSPVTRKCFHSMTSSWDVANAK